MLNKLNYTYNGENSIIHNVNSGIKIIGLLIYILISLLKFNNTLFILKISLVFLLLLLSNISLLKYVKIVWKMKYLLVLMYFILLKFNFEVNDINILLFDIVFLVLYIAMLVYTTTKEELGESVSFVIDRVNILGFNMKGFTSFCTNILACIESFIDGYNEIVIDMELKGKEYVSGNIIDRVVLFKRNIKIFFGNVSLKMKSRKKSMLYRLYDNKVKSKYKYKRRFGIYDYAYLALFISLIIFYVMRVK